MKLLLVLIVIVSFFAIGGEAVAKKTPKADSQLSTDMTFTGADVNGRYNYQDEALASVENEKILSDLLDLRRHFKDRTNKDVKKR